MLFAKLWLYVSDPRCYLTRDMTHSADLLTNPIIWFSHIISTADIFWHLLSATWRCDNVTLCCDRWQKCRGRCGCCGSDWVLWDASAGSPLRTRIPCQASRVMRVTTLMMYNITLHPSNYSGTFYSCVTWSIRTIISIIFKLQILN